MLLVVELDYPNPPYLKERLGWLEENIFPSGVFRKRRLVLLGGPELYRAIRSVEKPWCWESFEYTHYIYADLLTMASHGESYDFALFLNYRRDGEGGLGYARRDYPEQRCILRAMFIVAQGNVLFGDWGYPGDCPPEVTHDELRRTCTYSQLMYSKVMRRVVPNESDIRPGPALLYFLDHFLPVLSVEVEAMPISSLERIRAGVDGTLFDPYARRRAYWYADWLLYFAEDSYVLSYHKWSHGFQVQRSLVWNYMAVRYWFV